MYGVPGFSSDIASTDFVFELALVGLFAILFNLRRNTAPGRELGSFELGSFELGSFELGSLEVGSLDVGSLEVGSLEVGFFEVGSFEVGSLDVSASHVGIAKVRQHEASECSPDLLQV